MLPGILVRVAEDDEDDPNDIFNTETAAFEEHPVLDKHPLTVDDEFVFLDRLGVTDTASEKIAPHTFDSAALLNLIPTQYRTPDMTIHRGSMPIGEYSNPDLFPGLFPTLFPLGIGGLEDKKRQVTPVAFQTHAKYLLDLEDRSVSQHRSFIFIVVNILQRRAAHLHTKFYLKASRLEEPDKEFENISPEQISRVARLLEGGGRFTDIESGDSVVLRLLRIVDTIAAKVPGSHISKVALRKKIFAYMRHFGLPMLYLTANPNPVHSPLFQVLFGDERIDLAEIYPYVVDSVTQSLRVARDPAAAAEFFDLSINLMLEHLLGWDF